MPRITRRTRLVERLCLLVLGLALARAEHSHKQQPDKLESSDREQSVLGMEFDSDTGEELLKTFVPRDNSIIADFQQIVDIPDTTIVLLGEENRHKDPLVIYQTGKSEADLPECGKNEVCSKVDLYGDPWVERQCRCGSGRACSHSLHADDGHSIIDKTRQYKLCEPVKRLPICRYFKDITWTIAPGAGPHNRTVHKTYCRCRPGSVAYLVRRQFYELPEGTPNFVYAFACSPQSRMKCQPKEPCRLFTVHKRPSSPLEEVNASPLCQCNKGFRCPKRHTDPGSIPSSYFGESFRVFSGHCYPARHASEPVYTLV